MTDKLLKEYAESGDEIFFAENYSYAGAAARLPVMAEKNLTISSRRIEIDGGFRLRGVSSDKDLSYGALLAAGSRRISGGNGGGNIQNQIVSQMGTNRSPRGKDRSERRGERKAV